MKDLSLKDKSGQTMSSKELYDIVCLARAEYGESKPRMNDFHDRIADELEGDHYESFVVQNPNNTKTKFYRLSLEQCTLVGMRESKAVRRSVLATLKEMEARQAAVAPELPDFNDPVAAARAWADVKEAEQKAIATIEAQKPKVAFVENLVERNTLMTATQVAQKHGLSAIKLNRILDELGGIYSKSVKRSRVFCQSWVDKGYGQMKQTETGHDQALFTPAGEVRIHELMIIEGVL